MSEIKVYRWAWEKERDVQYPLDIEIIQFPGGEPHVKLPANSLEGEICTIEAHITDGNIMPVLVLNDALRRAGANVSLYMPYFPGARQDRGLPLTVKVYADMINAAEFAEVMIVDPHSDVLPALLDNVKVVSQARVFEKIKQSGLIPFPKSGVLVAPDQGAVKKTEEIAGIWGYDVVYGRKHRDMRTGELTGFSVDWEPDGRRPIVVDDICDGGGTFLGLAEHLWEDEVFRPKPILVVTHGIFSGGKEKTDALFDSFAKVICTDSFQSSHYDERIDFVNLSYEHISSL